jgi:hypothetical protein
MSHHRQYKIIKAHGGAEPFSRNKLFRSLRRSGLPPRKCSLITNKVSSEIYEGATTRDIYRRAFQLVKQTSTVAAAHYSLKKALFELGPTGHHFETFVARYFEARGFQTETRRTIQGKFVTHEVDVVATRGGEQYFVECKFHNRQGIRNDIKIALYVKARWDDLREGPEGKKLTGFYLATNTAFTADAIKYAKGTKLGLMGINAPEERSFFDDIRNLKLYPVTSLRRLSKIIRNELIVQDILLANELLAEKKLLLKLGMTEADFGMLSEEILLLQRNGP